MAHFTVDGYKNAGTDDVLAIDPVQFGMHGPAHTRWVERHVYWVLPLGTLFLFSLIFLVWFWGSGGSFRAAWGTAFTQSVGQVWTPVQPAQPTPPAHPQVTVNVPDRIHIDATVRDVTAPPPVPAPSRELTPEEKAEQLKQEIRAQYGVR